MGDFECITIKEYIEIQFRERDKALGTALVAMDKRLDQMNEFRGALRDQASLSITRAEFEIQHQRVVDSINVAKEQSRLYVTRSELVGACMAVSALMTLVMVVLKCFHT